MLLNKKGDIMKVDGKEFAVGMEICCNDKSNYFGLNGYINEFRTEEDKETENDGVDIVCEFNAPEDAEVIVKLEKKFSELYGKPMQIDNIALDYVIMSPEMLDIPCSDDTAEDISENIEDTDEETEDDDITEPVEKSDVVKREPEVKTDDRKKKEHEESEAKRKAEWEKQQAAKKAAEDKLLKETQSMSDSDAAAASVKKLGDDTERLTRRNMKICVTEHIQEICLNNPEFARKAMHPRKSMINCFKYINKKAQEYLKQEMEESGEKAIGGGYGGDVPDDLCYQWAEDYFNDPNAEADKDKDDKFVPKPYYGGSPAKTNKKETPKAKEPVTEKNSKACGEQIDLFGGAA